VFPWAVKSGGIFKLAKKLFMGERKRIETYEGECVKMGDLSKIVNTGSVLKIAGGALKTATKLRTAMREGFGDIAEHCRLVLFIN
jgi:hypothetical protein